LFRTDSYQFPTEENPNDIYYVSFCNDLPNSLNCGSDTMVTRHYPIPGSTAGCDVLSGSDPTKDADFDPIEEDTDKGLKITYNSGNIKDGCKGEPTFQI